MTTDHRTVLVIDDDLLVRDSLTDLFESIGLRVAAFASTSEFLRGPHPDGPCCLVLDIRMPGQSGLEFQRDLNKANLRIPIIFLTGHGDIPMSVRAMKAGAVEFLTKPFREQELLDAVYLALQRDVANRAEEKLVGQLRGRFASLSPREQTVMALVVSGLMNKQVAGEIGTGEGTAKVHRANVMRKMQATSLAELIEMAGKLGMSRKSK